MELYCTPLKLDTGLRYDQDDFEGGRDGPKSACGANPRAEVGDCLGGSKGGLTWIAAHRSCTLSITGS